MNIWQKEFDIEFPECKMTGQCCRVASPSTPAHKLLQKAAEGSMYAREFFNIFVPYPSHEAARLVSPGTVERSLACASTQEDFEDSSQVHFYKCLYLADDNKCKIHEDRPQICRNFPDSPFTVMPPGCAFEGWKKSCKDEYSKAKENLKFLKELQETLTDSSYQSIGYREYPPFIVSPGMSWYC